MFRGSWNILLLDVPRLLEHSLPNVPQLLEHLKKYIDSDFLGGWNIHQVKAFQPDSTPNTVLPLDQADLLQPTFRGRQKGPVYDGSYQLVVPDREIRWPPPEHDGPVTNGSRTAPPSACRSCARAAAEGSSLIRYRPQQVSVWCSTCMSDPGRRPYYVPALDDDGEDDHLDTCQGPHYHAEDCQYLRCAYKANVRWLYANYPDRYEACDVILYD